MVKSSEFYKVFFKRCFILSGIGYIDFEDGTYIKIELTRSIEVTRLHTMLEF